MSIDLNAVRQLNVQPRGNTLIIRGMNLHQVPEAEMNAHGWYRK